MSPYKVGIVGFGWVAGAHLKSYADLAQFEPVAVMSRRELDPEMFRREFGLDIKVYNDYDKFLAEGGMDIVDICTPHPQHPEQTIKAAQAGKNLVIEKPIAIDFESAVAMLEAVEKAGVRTSVCFEARFVSVARTMKSIIDQGLIGDPYYAECDYFHGIGPWYDQFAWNIKKDMGGSSLLTAGCHSVDMMLYLLGLKAEEVFSYSTINPHEDYKPYEYDTTSLTTIKFEGGKVLGKVSSVTDCMQPYVFNMNMVGSHGSLKNDLFFSKKIDGMEGWAKLDVQLVDSGDVEHHPYREQFSYYAECLEKGIDGHNSLANAFETHRVVFAADKSATTGKPVSLKEFSR